MATWEWLQKQVNPIDAHIKMSNFTAETWLQLGTKTVLVSVDLFTVHDNCAGVEFLSFFKYLY